MGMIIFFAQSAVHPDQIRVESTQEQIIPRLRLQAWSVPEGLLWDPIRMIHEKAKGHSLRFGLLQTGKQSRRRRRGVTGQFGHP